MFHHRRLFVSGGPDRPAHDVRVNENDRPTVHRHVLIELREGLSHAAHFSPIRRFSAAGGGQFQHHVGLHPHAAVRHPGSPRRLPHAGPADLGHGRRRPHRRPAPGRPQKRRGPRRADALDHRHPGAGMLFFGFSNALWLSLLGLIFVGFGTMTQMASCNTMLQTLVEDRMRGRVMSSLCMAFMGMMPGLLVSGQLAGSHRPGQNRHGRRRDVHTRGPGLRHPDSRPPQADSPHLRQARHPPRGRRGPGRRRDHHGGKGTLSSPAHFHFDSSS